MNNDVDLRKISVPFAQGVVETLHSGDYLLLSGEIYTARDAAHKKMIQLLDDGKELPLDIRGKIIYYCGPCPARPGEVIGSAGPTTSGRMDFAAPRLIAMGLSGMIGKGSRNDAVKKTMIDYKSVYLVALGGAGVLLADCVKACEPVAFSELGPEAIYRLTVESFPVFVGYDIYGCDIYSR